jgi:hypothetical protein
VQQNTQLRGLTVSHEKLSQEDDMSDNKNHRIYIPALMKRHLFAGREKGTIYLAVVIMGLVFYTHAGETTAQYPSGTAGASDPGISSTSYTGELFLPITGNRAYAIHFYKGYLYFVTGDVVGNGKLTRLSPDGTVTDITALSGTFIGPGLDTDEDGNFYIPLGDHVVKVTPDGSVKTLFECSTFGIKRALDLILDLQKNMYIADDIQDKVFKIDTSLQARVYIDNQLGKEQNYSLSDLVFDRDYHNLYLAEGGRSRLLKFPIDPDGEPGSPEILYENTKIGQIFNLCLSGEDTVLTVPVSGNKLVVIDGTGSSENTLTGAAHVIACKSGGSGFDPNSVYLTGSRGIIRVEMNNIMGIEEHRIQPAHYGFLENYPNPFNPLTIIRYALPRRQSLIICVADLLGRQVAVLANGIEESGTHDVTWDASSMAGGIYIVRLLTEEFESERKVILMK